MSRAQDSPASSPSSGQEQELTEEQRDLFIAIWAERMPQVVNWSDDEILYGMFVGM